MGKESGEGESWPGWARGLASVVVGFHGVAMVAIALAGRPASRLEVELAEVFAPYAELIHQGQTHRYYAPAPPPTPIVIGEVRDVEGRVIARRRLPDRGTRPRLRYQRELALAYHLYVDYQAAGAGRTGVWGWSYARHLLAVTPGGDSVTLRVQQHLVPDLVGLRGEGPIDPDDERFYTVPEVVVEYPGGVSGEGGEVGALEGVGGEPSGSAPPAPARLRSPFARPGS